MTYASAADVCRYWLNVVHAALVSCSRPEVKTRFVGSGEVAWDDCCGLLVVAPEAIFRYVAFPEAATGAEDCILGDLGMNLNVTLVRCAPTVSDRGIAPSADALDNAHTSLLEDAAVVWTAMSGDLPAGMERAGLAQSFVGAQGGCIAVETRMVVGIEQSKWVCCD